MAEEENDNTDQIDLTSFDFVIAAPEKKPTCATCHPGGGPLEFDRKGNRYDEWLTANPELRDMPNGDYYKSQWDRSGVLEADCLICHKTTYDNAKRTAELKKWNFAWAPIIGVGIGEVTGSVKEGETPSVSYFSRFFDDNGRFVSDMRKAPADGNCMMCHGGSDMKKRGRSWGDPKNHDVHYEAGLHCVDCHTSDISHNFAKGDAIISSVRDDLDGTILTCSECHEKGYLGATKPVHEGFPDLHFERISCEACHIPHKDRASMSIADTITGSFTIYPSVTDVEKFGDEGRWKPVYIRRDDGKIYPVNPIYISFWGNREGDEVKPLFFKEIKAAFKVAESKITDDNKDGKPEINTDEEMLAMAEAIRGTLKGNKRFTEINPVFFKGGLRYEIGENGEITTEEDEMAAAHYFSISHNVAPSGFALGADGKCTDCHSMDSHFFTGAVISDPFGPDGNPEYKPMYKLLGYSGFTVWVSSFMQKYFKPGEFILYLVLLFAILVHYLAAGPRIVANDETGLRETKRFTFPERLVHWVLSVMFLLLAFTGFCIAFGYDHLVGTIFGSEAVARMLHPIFGVVFAITVIYLLFKWIRNGILAHHDWEWAQKFGGYLGFKGYVPAAKFNAGQKLCFWHMVINTVVLTATGVVMWKFADNVSPNVRVISFALHDISSFMIFAGFTVHFYLSIFANPGTLYAMTIGKVTEKWAEHHHPVWFKELKEKPKKK